jgi:hypothetical protein
LKFWKSAIYFSTSLRSTKTCLSHADSLHQALLLLMLLVFELLLLLLLLADAGDLLLEAVHVRLEGRMAELVLVLHLGSIFMILSTFQQKHCNFEYTCKNLGANNDRFDFYNYQLLGIE